MHKQPLPSPTLAETALSFKPAAASIRGTLAALTGVAAAASLILAMTLPVSADRKSTVCAATIGGVEPVGVAKCAAHP